MTRKAKSQVYMVIFFSLIAIAVAVLHVVGIIKNLDSYLSMTYMSYFLGLAMMYLGAYHKQKKRYSSMRWCYGVSVLLILVAVVSLIYGLCTGEISLFL